MTQQPSTEIDPNNSPQKKVPQKITQLQCLDENLYLKDIFMNWFSQSFKYLPNILSSIYPEIEIMIAFAQYRFTIARDKPQVGDYLQNLTYKNLSKTQKILFFVLQILLPYIKKRFMLMVQKIQEKQQEQMSSLQKIISKIGKTLRIIQKFIAFASFLNLSVFIYNGKYRTLTQHLLKMQMIFSKQDSSRILNFTLMNRTLIWQVYQMFLKTVLPYVHNLIGGTLKNVFYLHSYLQINSEEHNLFCMFCGQKPTMVVKCEPCEHRACYYCWKSQNQQEKCKKCGLQIQKWEKMYL